MAGSEAIINKIISDAKENADVTLKAADKRAEEIIAAAKVNAEEYLGKERTASEEAARLIVERRKTVAALDAKKIALKARQELIDECFEEAENKILSLGKEEYLAFVGKLVEENAEDGDLLVLSSEEKYIDNAFVEALSEKLGKKLGISDEKETYVGGIVLRSSSCDKNLTLKALLRSVREDKEKEIADILEVL